MAVRLIEEKVGHPIMKLHCIIHQENLRAKMSNSDLNEVMAAVAKVINFIVKRSALTHRQFQSLLEEMDSAYSNLALHSAREVAKLRKGFRAVCRLLRCIKAFLSTAGGRAVGGETHVSDGHNGTPQRAQSPTAVQGKLFWTCSTH